MHKRTRVLVVVSVTCATSLGVIPAVVLAQSSLRSQQQPQPESDNPLVRSRELPEYTASGELKLPAGWREWIFVGEPFTPNALNDGHANFPEFHNVYIEPGSYAIYKKTGVFPEGTIFVKELQLTMQPAENPDGSQTQPSGRGYFPGEFNGADVTVKDSKRFAASGGWGYFNFNHHEPKALTAKVKATDECAFCHIASAKRDEVWTQFYRILDQVPAPQGAKGG
ncbi:MAG: cytochrome P460 family protein [Rhodospirillales bacterium]|nr:cytochrome P460 family protein [Acetobacter sp.]